MNRFLCFGVLFFSVLLPCTVTGAEKSYAIFSITSQAAGEMDPAFFAESLAVELKKRVPAGEWIYPWNTIRSMRAKPAENQPLTVCDDDSCLISFGRALGVTFMIAVSMDSATGGSSVLLRLIDLAGGITKRRATATVPGTAEGLIREVPKLVRRILGTEDTATVASKKKAAAFPALEMVLIPGGSFKMGSSDGEPDERPVRQITVGGFYLSRYEVTQAQFRRVMGNNPSQFTGCPECPVERVSWNDAQEYCRLTGTRLPTEAEWEYACRSGSITKFYWGDTVDNACAWYLSNADSATHPVGKKKPNAWGLHDMSGNVWEWCSDWYGKYPPTDSKDTSRPANSTCRVIRGGSWGFPASRLRSANRSFDSQEARRSIGFRVAKSAQ